MPIINMVYKKKWRWKPWANTIAWYKFEWDAKDYSWNWYDLTANWNVSYTTLNWRQVVYMQGSSSWNSTKLQSANFARSATIPSTYSIWCRTNTTSGSYPNQYILFQSVQNASPRNRQWIMTARWNGDYRIWLTSNSWLDTWIYPYKWDNTFHHIVATIDTSTSKLYVDGVNVYTWSWTSSISYTNWINVWSNDNTYYWFNGYIWDAILESKIWSAEDVSNYYNSTKSNYGL